ncbi:hypothetical protein HanIR_Chr17g0895811 [Helianthus annuus]|nr:hypothetical protein HanIR_Chr17g0895811 [Helianthus annuus]
MLTSFNNFLIINKITTGDRNQGFYFSRSTFSNATNLNAIRRTSPVDCGSVS